MRSKQQHGLYRDAQNDYWEAHARRARRTLAARKAVKTAMSVVTRQFADATGGTFVPA